MFPFSIYLSIHFLSLHLLLQYILPSVTLLIQTIYFNSLFSSSILLFHPNCYHSFFSLHLSFGSPIYLLIHVFSSSIILFTHLFIHSLFFYPSFVHPFFLHPFIHIFGLCFRSSILFIHHFGTSLHMKHMNFFNLFSCLCSMLRPSSPFRQRPNSTLSSRTVFHSPFNFRFFGLSGHSFNYPG